MIAIIKKNLDDLKASPEKISRFFKTGKGEYSCNDLFIGVTVPNLRIIAKEFKDIDFADLKTLITSKINEERLLALIILVSSYKSKNDLITKENIYQFYLKYLDYVNNWNLVDASAHLIIGNHLYDKNRDLLMDLVKSENMWYRRISIVSTWYFIKQNDLTDTFKIAKLLLHDKEDLIHKASGWMLREAGKKSKSMLVEFLDDYGSIMPRTMLRYSIEKFSSTERNDIIARTKKLAISS